MSYRWLAGAKVGGVHGTLGGSGSHGRQEFLLGITACSLNKQITVRTYLVTPRDKQSSRYFGDLQKRSKKY